MSAATVSRQNPIRIVRRDSRRGGQAYFQPAWQPVFCPQMSARGESGPLDETQADKSWRIPRRYHTLAASTALTLASTAIVSFGVTVKNVGLTLDTGLIWLAAWPVSAIIAIPLRLVLTPLIDRCIDPLIEPSQPQN